MHVCLGVTCHLHFWQNDRGLLHATAVTRGWNRQWIGVSTKSWLWRRKFSPHSCRNLNWQPFDHEPSALTNKLSWLLRDLTYFPANSRKTGYFPAKSRKAGYFPLKVGKLFTFLLKVGKVQHVQSSSHTSHYSKSVASVTCRSYHISDFRGRLGCDGPDCCYRQLAPKENRV